MRLIYDIETDGLFDVENPTSPSGTKAHHIKQITRVHCIVTQDLDTGEVRRYVVDGPFGDQSADDFLDAGVTAILAADLRAGHNVTGYDERVLEEFFPAQWAARNPAATVRDTLVGVAAVWPNEHIKSLDFVRNKMKGGDLPKDLVGRHSLRAWGWRLGNKKAAAPEDFSTFTPAMLAYCVQDVSTTATLFKKLEARIQAGRFTERAWELEQEFAACLRQQERNGFKFDVPAAEHLTALLQGKRAELMAECVKVFAPFENVERTSPEVIENAKARVDMWVRRGNEAKAQKARENLENKKRPKVKVVPFNPGSDKQIARYLTERCGWKPGRKGYTPTGQPKVDEAVLIGLTHLPGVPLLLEYGTVTKVLSMVAEAANKNSKPWMRCVKADGRIHGRVTHNGAGTCRSTHSQPNMTQVPKPGNPFGFECRALFTVEDLNLLIGMDAKALEPRLLGHFLKPYDGGEFITRVCEGTLYEKVQALLRIPDSLTARDTAKRAFLAVLYGALAGKLSRILTVPFKTAEANRTTLLLGIPGLNAFRNKCIELHRTKGAVRMPDGRYVFTRSEHGALNSVLQGSGAIVMKQTVVLANRYFRSESLDARQVHMSHDEIQTEAPRAQAQRVGELLSMAVEDAGVALGIRCPMKGEIKIGKNWKETH